MKRSLYLLLAILCVTHAVLVSFALFTSSVRAFFLMVATAVWFVWPVIIWRVGAKKWRLALPLLLGFVALLPTAAMCLLWILIACTPPQQITPFARSLTANNDPRTVRGLIIAAAPKGWSVIPQKVETNNLFFYDPKTEVFTLVGPEYFNMVWKDNNGQQHQDKILRETLDIWVVPGDFKLTLGFKDDVYFEEIFASPGACVYACNDSIVEDTKRFEKDFGVGGTGETPPHSLSWTNWRKDIVASLEK